MPFDTTSFQQQPDLPKDTHEAANAHDLVQQMLNPLINNADAAPTPSTLFPDLPIEMPHVEEEEDAKQPPPPEPPKKWIEHVYTFQDLQTQANLCNWIGDAKTGPKDD